MNALLFCALLLTVLLAPLHTDAADLCARDVRQLEVCLSGPAQRVVSLSPGSTELLFSVGAGGQVAAVSAWSDFPPEAERLPQVGDSSRLDLEAIVALQPDLVVAWVDGNSVQQVDRLAALGVPVYWLAPREFGHIAKALEDLGTLTGNAEVAARMSADFLNGLEALAQRYAGAAPVRVFYQIWDRPLMTVNRQELIGNAIELCGGVNVFADLPRLVPRVSRESVLAAAPEVIITAGRGGGESAWLEAWRSFPELPAVAADNLYLEPPDLLARPTLRMLDGVTHLCGTLERARGRL